MTGVLIDSNVFIDVIDEDSAWFEWSNAALNSAVERSRAVINAVIFAEVSVYVADPTEMDQLLPESSFVREHLPYEAAFCAGKSFQTYRQRGGLRRSPLPDFFIGAHALIAGYPLLTRDATRYRTYFPQLVIIAPN